MNLRLAILERELIFDIGYAEAGSTSGDCGVDEAVDGTNKAERRRVRHWYGRGCRVSHEQIIVVRGLVLKINSEVGEHAYSRPDGNAVDDLHRQYGSFNACWDITEERIHATCQRSGVWKGLFVSLMLFPRTWIKLSFQPWTVLSVCVIGTTSTPSGHGPAGVWTPNKLLIVVFYMFEEKQTVGGTTQYESFW
jgi:hypothetical protein